MDECGDTVAESAVRARVGRVRRELEVAPVVSSAFAATISAVVGQIGEINHRIKELEAELASYFEQHPDAAIYRSMPGLGVVLGASWTPSDGSQARPSTTARPRVGWLPRRSRRRLIRARRACRRAA